MDDNTNLRRHGSIAETISGEAFPCVGAKAALARNALRIVECGNLLDAREDTSVLLAIQAFAQATSRKVVFTSLVLNYPHTPALSEGAFEVALWQRLQSLHEQDRNRYAWDHAVSNDPDSRHFSMSVGGRGFYVIGLHAGASRPARRIPGAALVFNLHSQFEALREDGRYDKLSAAIRARDLDFAGNLNPMLARHGDASEARQYSGRAVPDDWQCPFHAVDGRAA